ncbi:hypothetical protein CK203_091604 [Vitis vinifera]|uniref:Uncharacterized protein n=1 Tax=Vitis vinifera TaxID=29760 RepID=A0A438D0S0_VITVI|nr:hypothetical protein CK203_091604 [Vitis vinifera]
MSPRSPKAYQVLAILENPTLKSPPRGSQGDFTSSSLLAKTIELCTLALGTFPDNLSSKELETPKRAAKLFRNTELSSQGCEVGFHLEVPSSLLAAWFVNRQKEKHLTVQKCCEITSQQKGDFATLCKMLPSARSDWLVMAATSSFQLRIAHRLKHWIVDFLSFEMIHSWQMNSKLCPRFLIALLILDLLRDGLPMQGQDSVTILSMFHDILEKETPFVVLMVTKGWRIGKQWVEGNGLLRQSLHAGLVPPSGPSSCTHIPRQRGGRCTLNEINIGGRVGLAPPAFPNFVIDVAVASVA